MNVNFSDYVELVQAADACLLDSTRRNFEASFRIHGHVAREMVMTCEAVLAETKFLLESVDPGFVLVREACQRVTIVHERRLEAAKVLGRMKGGPGPANTLSFLAKLDDHVVFLSEVVFGLLFARYLGVLLVDPVGR